MCQQPSYCCGCLEYKCLPNSRLKSKNSHKKWKEAGQYTKCQDQIQSWQHNSRWNTVHETCPLGKHNQQSKQQAKATSWNILQYAPLMILNLWIRRNQFSVIHEVDDIDNNNIDSPELKENILTGQYIGVDINKTACCMVCNKSLPTEALDDEMITCNNCKITPLSLLKCPRL